MLQDETENDEQWHYLNALIHFASNRRHPNFSQRLVPGI
jgi:hypothetical protein